MHSHIFVVVSVWLLLLLYCNILSFLFSKSKDVEKVNIDDAVSVAVCVSACVAACSSLATASEYIEVTLIKLGTATVPQTGECTVCESH